MHVPTGRERGGKGPATSMEAHSHLDRDGGQIVLYAIAKVQCRLLLLKSIADAGVTLGATPERVQQLTLHSFRRFLACALLAANVSEHQICALLRWRSTKSLAAYAALNAKAYSSMIEATERAQVDSIRTANLRRHVVTDVEDVVRNLMGDNQALAAAAAPDGRDLLECDEDDLFGDD